MSFGKYLYAGGFIQKIAPGTTVIHSKQVNQRQQVIQPAKTTKDNSRRFQKTPPRSLGQTATKVGWSAQALGRPACSRVCLPSIASYAFPRSTLLI